MLNDKQKAIVHHRWLVFAIVVAIIITLLGLWEFVLYIAGGLLILYLALEGIAWLISWLSGADLNSSGGHVPADPDEADRDSVSDTLWDIETMHAMQHHNDDYPPYHDYLNDDSDGNDDDNDLY
ncbi:MAG: hypothetical protein ACI4T4_03065 [Limosilactobacillus sp.]